MTAVAREAGADVIAARATVVLDARALDELGPATIDRLADLVAQRLRDRRAAGEVPLFTGAPAAGGGGGDPGTVGRGGCTRARQAGGVAGKRPRARGGGAERWLR